MEVAFNVQSSRTFDQKCLCSAGFCGMYKGYTNYDISPWNRKLEVLSNLLPLAGFQEFKERDGWIDYNISGLKRIKRTFHIFFLSFFFPCWRVWIGCVQIMLMWYTLYVVQRVVVCGKYSAYVTYFTRKDITTILCTCFCLITFEGTDTTIPLEPTPQLYIVMW
jgi:hypothetical protein